MEGGKGKMGRLCNQINLVPPSSQFQSARKGTSSGGIVVSAEARHQDKLS